MARWARLGSRLNEIVLEVDFQFTFRYFRGAEPLDLFDGRTPDGWKRQGGRAELRVEDGMIIGRTVKNAGNTFFCTTMHYAGFRPTPPSPSTEWRYRELTLVCSMLRCKFDHIHHCKTG